jgi:8-oxo-dGTP pyrophosphatase MutT (NUDIX family)
MPISDYLAGLRAKVGTDLILLPGVSAIVRDAEGRVLLGRRSDDNRWGLPAGAIDPGEEPARAVIREVFEETGLRVRPERLVAVLGGREFFHKYPNGDEVEPTTSVFECRIIGGSLGCQDQEATELRFFDPGELPDLVGPYRRELLTAVARFAEPYFQWEEQWLEQLV